LSFDIDSVFAGMSATFADHAIEDLMLAVVAAYLFRTSHQTELAIALSDRSTDGGEGAGEPAHGLYAPFLLAIEGTQTFADVLEAVTAGRRAELGAWAPAGTDVQAGEGPSSDRPLPFAVTLAQDVERWVPGQARVELVVDSAHRHGVVFADPELHPEFAGRVLEHLSSLAQAVSQQPSQAIAQVPFLPAAERQRVISAWNSTDKDYPYEGGLVACMEKQVAETPDHPAVIFQGAALSYAEFNARANRLARHLRQSGVGSDTFVAICLDRSVEMVVAIWAVLKAGGAYVPLNVEDPPQRLGSIIRNAGAKIVLTDERLAKKLSKTRAKIIRLSPEDPEIAEQASDNLSLEIRERDLAYMIYTSGSTGEPKGVLIEHVAIHNRIVWMQDAYNLNPADRVLQKTPYTFDVSVWEFLWPLSVGATLVVAEPGGHVVPSYLIRLMRQEAITCAHFVPSVLRLFLRSPGIEKLPLRMIFCSGEALPSDLRDALLARHGCDLHNLYGPTEAAVDVSYFSCREEPHRSTIPIGKPISNIQLYVLDEQLQPVPVGVAGELFIGGIGVARGYWNRPELTTERFIADPFGATPGRKLYKTGDLARYATDGNIEYLGRNDHQVKINGARVELGEIEAVIRAHSMVRDAVVIAKKSESGNAQLFAYLVMKEHGTGAGALDYLREHLVRRLPPHMLPRTFTFLSHIPLSANGKVDRKQLPDPHEDA
jgi:amino acid adenylation domain-containing protein